ncbi:unnamed protein product [Cuscuta campestris]|uniref:Uncharacterized protein n=1 Tax=Cuscuta campestris TaxID=132261 RepID=A0A484ME71_9ASTE|nr:unnamed protein product [Cuscuta campestris]
MDALGRYHKIQLHLDDAEKTSFITLEGIYGYLVMAFKLRKSGATYTWMAGWWKRSSERQKDRREEEKSSKSPSPKSPFAAARSPLLCWLPSPSLPFAISQSSNLRMSDFHKNQDWMYKRLDSSDHVYTRLHSVPRNDEGDVPAAIESNLSIFQSAGRLSGNMSIHYVTQILTLLMRLYFCKWKKVLHHGLKNMLGKLLIHRKLFVMYQGDLYPSSAHTQFVMSMVIAFTLRLTVPNVPRLTASFSVMFRAWQSKARRRYTDWLSSIRNEKKGTEKVQPLVPQSWKEYWKSPKFLASSKQNKKNRRGGDENAPASATHTGGPLSFRETQARLGKSGKASDLYSSYTHTHTKKHDGKTYVNKKAEEVSQTYVAMQEAVREEGLNVTPDEIFLSTVGGHDAKNRVHVVGDLARSLPRMHASEARRASTSSMWDPRDDEIRRLREELDEIRASQAPLFFSDQAEQQRKSANSTAAVLLAATTTLDSGDGKGRQREANRRRSVSGRLPSVLANNSQQRRPATPSGDESSSDDDKFRRRPLVQRRLFRQSAAVDRRRCLGSDSGEPVTIQ